MVRPVHLLIVLLMAAMLPWGAYAQGRFAPAGEGTVSVSAEAPAALRAAKAPGRCRTAALPGTACWVVVLPVAAEAAPPAPAPRLLRPACGGCRGPDAPPSELLRPPRSC